MAEVARAYNASFIAGDYYLVWPSIFYTIHLRQEAVDPEALRVYGLAPKGEILRAVYAAYLRQAQRVVVVCAGMEVKESYESALHEDSADWPEHVSLLKRGRLPSGGPYCVLAFERDGAVQGHEAPLPAQGKVLLHRMKLNADVGHWDWDKAAVATAGKPVMALQGPYVNLPGGKYRASFEIITQGGGDPSAPLLQLDVQDRFGRRVFTRHVVAAGELEPRNGGVWASVEFEVPAGAPTENLDFCVWTFGTAEFSISDMEIRRLP